jgi:hypothetical protein
LSWFLARWAKRLSWKEVAEAFHTSWDHVFSSVEMAVSWGRSHRDLSNITAIGIDERKWQLGHHYLTLIYQIDAHCKGQFSSGIVEGFNNKAKLREKRMVLEPITQQKSLYIIHLGLYLNLRLPTNASEDPDFLSNLHTLLQTSSSGSLVSVLSVSLVSVLSVS